LFPIFPFDKGAKGISTQPTEQIPLNPPFSKGTSADGYKNFFNELQNTTLELNNCLMDIRLSLDARRDSEMSGPKLHKAPLCLFAMLILLGCAPTVATGDEILVSAAASLTDVLKEIGVTYQSKSKNKVNFTFGPSSTLARQIEEGAPADLFFSADLAQMDTLDRNGRLEPGSRKNLLSNRLVIIAPADSKITIASPKDLLKPDVKNIALAEPTSVPVGIYSSKYLDREGLWDELKRKIVPVLDVRATLAAVESGNVEAGFVYKTDAAISKKVKVVYEVPIDKGPKITYPVAIVKESKKKDAARDFMNFLLGPAGKETFRKYGFLIID
jgi:molybdate transport system substrate-binding protein